MFVIVTESMAGCLEYLRCLNDADVDEKLDFDSVEYEIRLLERALDEYLGAFPIQYVIQFFFSWASLMD